MLASVNNNTSPYTNDMPYIWTNFKNCQGIVQNRVNFDSVLEYTTDESETPILSWENTRMGPPPPRTTPPTPQATIFTFTRKTCTPIPASTPSKRQKPNTSPLAPDHDQWVNDSEESMAARCPSLKSLMISLARQVIALTGTVATLQTDPAFTKVELLAPLAARPDP